MVRLVGIVCSVTVLAGGCAAPDDPGVCAALGDSLVVGGETADLPGDVALVVHEEAGRVTLELTPTDDTQVHTASFALADAAVDDVVGAVSAEVGTVFAGEGSEYGYLRLTDERGVWFEGGVSGSIDDDAQGGTRIDGPFDLGSAIGERCKRGVDGHIVELHRVVAAVGDGGADVIVGADGVDGRWRDVPVRAVAVGAEQGEIVEPADTVDGLGPGPHDITRVRAYLYRVRD
jgi:hypothetical protein